MRPKPTWPDCLGTAANDLAACLGAGNKRRVAPGELLSGSLPAGPLVELFGHIAARRSEGTHCFQKCIAVLEQRLRCRVLRWWAARRGAKTKLRRCQG